MQHKLYNSLQVAENDVVMGSELAGLSLNGKGEGGWWLGVVLQRRGADKRDDAPDYNAPGKHPLLTF